jgi:hypothetical protein
LTRAKIIQEGVITAQAVNLNFNNAYYVTTRGTINVTGQGYPAGAGPGAGFNASAASAGLGGGGSYGGNFSILFLFLIF